MQTTYLEAGLFLRPDTQMNFDGRLPEVILPTTLAEEVNTHTVFPMYPSACLPVQSEPAPAEAGFWFRPANPAAQVRQRPQRAAVPPDEIAYDTHYEKLQELNRPFVPDPFWSDVEREDVASHRETRRRPGRLMRVARRVGVSVMGMAVAVQCIDGLFNAAQ